MIQSGGELKQQLLEEGKARGYIKAGLLPEYRAIGFQIGALF